jgi:hypothetical protein
VGAVGSATTAGPCPGGIVEPSTLVAVESQGPAVGGVVPANPFVPRFREATVAWLGEDGWRDASDARSGPHAVGFPFQRRRKGTGSDPVEPPGGHAGGGCLSLQVQPYQSHPDMETTRVEPPVAKEGAPP